MKQAAVAGMNGFGRFGQHLLKYWLERASDANYTINYINDAQLSLKEAFEILTCDKYLGLFYRDKVTLFNDGFAVTLGEITHRIIYTNEPDLELSWLGEPDIIFECSGKNTDATKCEHFIIGNTKRVVISATSENADATLVYGYNHADLSVTDHRILSYGSCTINAFVPLANYIHSNYGVAAASAHVIHNVPERFIGTYDAFERKTCTLEFMAPKLLNFVSEDNFSVHYTTVPYSGVSLFDYRFQLVNPSTKGQIIRDIKSAVTTGILRDLYIVEDVDNGSESYKFSPYSAILVETGIKVVGDDLYIQSYFDNENSVNRYHDLIKYIVDKDRTSEGRILA